MCVANYHDLLFGRVFQGEVSGTLKPAFSSARGKVGTTCCRWAESAPVDGLSQCSDLLLSVVQICVHAPYRECDQSLSTPSKIVA